MSSIFRRPALVIALLGTVLTLASAWGLYRIELRQVQNEFLQDVHTVAMDLELELKLSFEALYGLFGLFSSSEEVTRDEFERLAAAILQRHRELLALEWVPRVSADDRADFESRMDRLYGDYRIWQRDRQYQASDAAERAEYYPIAFLHPLQENRELLGLDIHFDPTREPVLGKEQGFGDLYITDPVNLHRVTPAQKGFFALIPVFHPNQPPENAERPPAFGYVRGVYRIDRLIQQLTYRPQSEQMHLVLTDENTAEGFEPLYDSHPGASFDIDDAYKVNINPADGRQWSLLAAPLSPLSLRVAALWTPLQVGLLGLTLSWLIAAVVHLLQRRSEQIERIVERRTQELNQLNEKLKTLSMTDELTGIANRRAFESAFRREWRRAARYQNSLAIAMIDIDFFKSYNDTFGHPAGDRCLQQVAQTLNEQIKRPGDLLARYGGEEFVLLLPHTDEQTAQFGEQCRHAVEALQIKNPGSYYEVLTVSLGMAVAWPDPDEDPLTLLKEADKALYHGKETGRNRVILRTLARPATASATSHEQPS